MTNEKAKKRLEVWLICANCPEDKKCYDSHLHSTCEYTDYCDDVPIGKAVKVAIEALQQEPCDDAISRQAAIDIIESWLSCDDCNEAERHIMRAMQSVLYDLPVTPQPKMGHWVDVDDSVFLSCECSECKKLEFEKSNYCPRCGIKMDNPWEGY